MEDPDRLAALERRMGRLSELQGVILDHHQELMREVFLDFYPQLTEEEIAAHLRAHGNFTDGEVHTLTEFYRTTSYAESVGAPGSLGQAGVRTCVHRALQKLPHDSELYVALRMAEEHRNILEGRGP